MDFKSCEREVNTQFEHYRYSRNRLDRPQAQAPVLWHTPATFCTPFQMLHLRFVNFFVLQEHFASTISILSRLPSYREFGNYVALIGTATQSQNLPFVLSDTDAYAPAVLSSISGRCLAKENVLLDRLDVAECISKTFMLMRSSWCSGMTPSDLLADMAVSSFLRDMSQVEKLALHPLLSLFQTMPHSNSQFLSVSPTTCYDMAFSATRLPLTNTNNAPTLSRQIQLFGDTVFQRFVCVLRQHIYWLPLSQVRVLLGRELKKDEVQFSYTCGPTYGIECSGVSHFPLENVLQCYQLLLAKELLSQVECTADVWYMLEHVLNLHTAQTAAHTYHPLA